MYSAPRVIVVLIDANCSARLGRYSAVAVHVPALTPQRGPSLSNGQTVESGCTVAFARLPVSLLRIRACLYDETQRATRGRESRVTYVENRISFLSTVGHLLSIPTSDASGNFETHPTRLQPSARFSATSSRNSPRLSIILFCFSSSPSLSASPLTLRKG